MSNSGSYSRGEQPRSVVDHDKKTYDEMTARQRAYNARQEAQLGSYSAADPRLLTLGGEARVPATARERTIEHPGALESMIPIWGSGKEALADLEDGDYIGAFGNGALAASDVFLAKAIAGGLVKGAWKAAGSNGWRQTRRWLVKTGQAKPGMPAHHVFIERANKAVPDFIKNQPWNLKMDLDQVQHGRIHGPYSVGGVRLPQFSPAERLWYGAPRWTKALSVSAPGHAATASDRSSDSGR